MSSMWTSAWFALALLCWVTVASAHGDSIDSNERCDHPDFSAEDAQSKMRLMNRANPAELSANFWRTSAQQHLTNRLQQEPNTNRARNVIMFLGDGMSLATVAATRVYNGGEEESLSFEKFPHFGLSKTYCVNRQVADSACTATAYLCGVKANYGTMGVNAKVPRYECDTENEPINQVDSIAKWALDGCKAAGLVTTARVTHASPGGVFAHTANRDWENDAKVKEHSCDPNVTIDIARQLIEGDVGSKLKVIIGGGRREFRNTTVEDEEGRPGRRTDGRDLIKQWQDTQKNQSRKASYVWNRDQLQSIDYANVDYLMGLFEDDHCLYNLDLLADPVKKAQEPTLSEMTEAAIKVLNKNEEGYFLFVESGRIDMAHHDNKARRALGETSEFSRAIDLARRMTNESDTLIVVTSDHSHVMSYNGYPLRGNDILGLSGRTGSDGLPYTTLSYANGMGYYNTYENGVRKDLSEVDFKNPDTLYPAMVPRDSETHGGDDVGVYASGPWSHLFAGNYEQNVIPIAMAYAAEIGPYANVTKKCSGAEGIQMSVVLVLVMSILTWFVSQ